MAKKGSLKDMELNVKAERISKEHLDQMQKLVNAVNSMQFNVGRLETQKHMVLHNLTQAQDRITLFQQTLKKEYGTFDVNIEDGTINWPEEKEEEENEK